MIYTSVFKAFIASPKKVVETVPERRIGKEKSQIQ
jgi:hypothetical protein